MTGPEHFRRAEELAAKARQYLGRGDGQDSAALWATVAQVHATLALAAATALDLRQPDGDRQAWAGVVSAVQPHETREAAPGTGPGQGPR
jgi:hypothetical protein